MASSNFKPFFDAELEAIKAENYPLSEIVEYMFALEELLMQLLPSADMEGYLNIPNLRDCFCPSWTELLEEESRKWMGHIVSEIGGE